MARISLLGNISVDMVRSFASSIDTSSSLEIYVQPHKLAFQTGADLEFLQLIVTWVRGQSIPSLSISFKRETREEKPLSSDTHRLIAFLSYLSLIAKISKGELAPTKLEDLRRSVERLPNENLLFALCVDRPIARLSPLLYELVGPNEYLRTTDELEDLFLDLLHETKHLVPLYQQKVQYVDGLGLLARVIFELFKNTHQHGTSLYDGTPNPFSVRGVSVLLRTQKIEDTSRRKPFDQYLLDLCQSQKKSPGDTFNLLEITVFDSGSGLARHFTGSASVTSGPLKAEGVAVRSCFMKHKTSTNEPHKGIGLFRVQRELYHLRGFMRMRTGRLDLFRSAFFLPTDERTVLWDAESGQPNYRAQQDFQGTFLSLFVPVEPTVA